MRLRNRKEGFYSYQEGGITQPTSSLGYISEAERFITDVAAVAKSEREADHAKRDQMVQAKRANKANREEQRWKSIEAEAEFDERRAQEMREVRSRKGTSESRCRRICHSGDMCCEC